MLERGMPHDGGLQLEEMREAHEQPGGNQMVGAGLEKSIPWEVSLDEHVRPESGRGRAQFEASIFTRRNQIAKVDQKSLPSRRQFDQQPWNLRGLRNVDNWPNNRHPSIVDALSRLRIADRAA